MSSRCAGPCPKGFYCQHPRTLHPLLCPVSSWCGEGSSAPTPCPAGTVGRYEGLTDANQCEDCSKGTWCSAGNSIDCPENTYNEETGSDNQGACLPCSRHSASPPASTSKSACVCSEDYYDSNADSTELPGCQPCPVGADCHDMGNTLEALPLLPGYWRLSRYAIDLRQCPDFNAGNASACVGGSGETCVKWTTGPYCQLCNVTDGSRYYANHRCVECEAEGVLIGSTLAYTFGLIAVLLVTMLLVLRLKPHQKVKWLRRLLAKAQYVRSHFDLWAKVCALRSRETKRSASLMYEPCWQVKQVITFYQIVSRIETVRCTLLSLSVPVSTGSKCLCPALFRADVRNINA